jgi:hypothetical protein
MSTKASWNCRWRPSIESLSGAPHAGTAGREPSDAGLAWRSFVERFAATMRFDDPGQPPPRSGGLGWIKLPLPQGYYVTSTATGAQVRFSGAEGERAYAELAADRDAIDREFTGSGLTAPEWSAGVVPTISLTLSSPLPWDEAREDEQRAWFARAGNQFVNSLRPRLQRIAAPTA